MSLVVTTADLHKRAGSGARPFEGANISTSEKHAGAMYEFMREFATLEPPPSEMQQLLAAMRGNQKAMDRFVQMNAGTISPAVFFAPANVGAIMAPAQVAGVRPS